MQNLFQVRFLKEKALILFLYFLFAAVLSSYHKYYIHLEDTFQYLVIAEDYSKGNFAEAVNSFWSPMFSWILAGFFKIGIAPFLSIQLLQIITGSVAMLGVFVLVPLGHETRILFLLFFFCFSHFRFFYLYQ